MPRYIDVDELLRKPPDIHDYYDESGEKDCAHGYTIATIKSAPTISPDEVRGVVHCKDCEWWTKQEASIQGRCARLAIYPTGEFYCASGSKREPPKEVE